MRALERIDAVDWELGSINDDDDFHTDVQFLRVAVRRLGHRAALLRYSGLRGVFFFSKSSTAQLCATFIEKLKRNADWGNWIVAEILRRSDDLWHVHDEPCGDLLRYQRQALAHAALYEVCWIPEILQAAEVGLTDYLRRFVAARLASPSDAFQAFIALTFDEEGSGALLLNETLLALVERARSIGDLFDQPLRYLRLDSPPWLLQATKRLADEYGYLAYHGYGSRRLDTPDDMLARVQQLFRNEREHAALLSTKSTRVKLAAERARLTRALRLDPVHRRLFRLSGRFSTLKLRRRLAQLKNFVYLDLLLDRFALALDISGRIVRFMLPEEVVEHVTASKRVSQRIRRRADAMVYYVDQRSEEVLLHPTVLASVERLEESVRSAAAVVLRGYPASVGTAVGRAVVIYRAEDAALSDFQPGDIIVTAEGDTDLLHVLQSAGGLVTDQGGVTCHLGTIARDLGIPAVLGTGNATRSIETGDTVLISATEGTVEKLPSLARRSRWDYR